MIDAKEAISNITVDKDVSKMKLQNLNMDTEYKISVAANAINFMYVLSVSLMQKLSSVSNPFGRH